MKDFFLSSQVLQTYLTREDPVDNLVEQARAALDRGGKLVVVDERHEGPPVVLDVVQTAAQLSAWARKLARQLAPEAVDPQADGLRLSEKPREVGSVEGYQVTERTMVAGPADGATDQRCAEVRLMHVLFSTPGRIRPDGSYYVVAPGGRCSTSPSSAPSTTARARSWRALSSGDAPPRSLAA